ncbi:MAG TPA: hypothetical protein VGL31_19905, partial [Xanthobacteraceae bacterium]
YIEAGLPGKLAPIASFDSWSDLVRSALVWLGCADPALSMEQAREDDPELVELTELLTAWETSIGSAEAFTVCSAAIWMGRERRSGWSLRPRLVDMIVAVD